MNGEHGELFFEWSTIVDAPRTHGMTEDELRDYIKEEEGNQGLRVLDERINKARKNGHSYFVSSDKTAEEFVRFNRAGPEESQLEPWQIYELVWRLRSPGFDWHPYFGESVKP